MRTRNFQRGTHPLFGENESTWGSSQGTVRKMTETLFFDVKNAELLDEFNIANDEQPQRLKFQETERDFSKDFSKDSL